MAKEQRCKLENEAKSWLQIQTLKAASEIGAGQLKSSFRQIFHRFLFEFSKKRGR